MEANATNRTTVEKGIALSFEELAAQQGVSPICDFESLLGHPSSEDETPEQFAAMLREWRREATAPPPEQ